MMLGGISIVSAWQVREVARRFYPNNIRLQRKWLRAWRRAPGPRCAVGKVETVDDAVTPETKRDLNAFCYYLNSRDRGSYVYR